jgi:hypothetical protein
MLLRATLFLAICIGVSALCFRYFGAIAAAAAPVGLMFAAPFLSKGIARFVIELLPAIARAGRWSAHRHWQGRYYVYGRQPVRFFLIEETVWVAEADLVAVLQPPLQEREMRLLGDEYGMIPGEKLFGATEAGLQRLLAKRTGTRHATSEMLKFKRWLETEALPNVRNLA